MSTNHKDIGTLYIIFGAFAGILGTTFSVFIRIQLAFPNGAFFSEAYQFYNVSITAHAFFNDFFYGNACFNWWFW
jgi:cytochrome c oxidase subunit 1